MEEQRIEQEAPPGDSTPPAQPVPDGDAEDAPRLPLAADDAEQVARPPESPDEPGIAADLTADAVPVGDAPFADDGLRERAAKADEYLALAQRTQADFENFRKRMQRDVRAAEARGMSRLAKELLPAIDNLERAVAALEASEEEHHLADGIRLVTEQLSAALQRTGIQGYAAKGERFDPVCHEAVAQTPVEGAEPGTIVEVLQAGYRLNDAILRPARVVVAG